MTGEQRAALQLAGTTGLAIALLNVLPLAAAAVRQSPGLPNQQLSVPRLSQPDRANAAETVPADWNRAQAAIAVPRPIAQAEPSAAESLLEIEGALDDSDLVLPVDDSRYDLYTFAGTAGQIVTIELESTDFDPYLFLIDPAGEQLAENDDISPDDRNSALTVELPSEGTYRVLVNSYDPDSRGRYRLVVRATSPSPAQQSGIGR